MGLSQLGGRPKLKTDKTCLKLNYHAIFTIFTRILIFKINLKTDTKPPHPLLAANPLLGLQANTNPKDSLASLGANATAGLPTHLAAAAAQAHVQQSVRPGELFAADGGPKIETSSYPNCSPRSPNSRQNEGKKFKKNLKKLLEVPIFLFQRKSTILRRQSVIQRVFPTFDIILYF